jgi:hypothetical protein
MLFRKPAVGREINAYCGKCKLERTHIIAAMDGEAVRKVTCNMCNSTHNYRGKAAPESKTTTATRASSSRAGRTSKKTKQANVFSIPSGHPVKAYSMRAYFSEGDIIDHPKFGLGAVEMALAPNKIEVRFQEGKKILLHNTKDV